MSDLISRGEVIDDLTAMQTNLGCTAITIDAMIEGLKRKKHVDAAPVVHAHWERHRDRTGVICSNCRSEWQWFEDKEYADIYARDNKFCYNCGARMDCEEGDEKNDGASDDRI